MFSQNAIDHRLNRRTVGNLLQAACRDDLIRAALARPQGVEHLFGEFVGQRVVLHPNQQTGQPRRRDRAIPQRHPLSIKLRRQRARNPVGREFRIGGGAQRRQHRFKIVRNGLVAGQNRRIVGAQSIGCLIALGLGIGQFGQSRTPCRQGGLIQHHRQQIRIGEIAVIIGGFFGAHQTGFIPIRVI